MACAACGPTKFRPVPVPVELTTCADEPVAPDLPARDPLALDQVQAERDRLTLAYILDLRSAWGSCKAAVAGVKAWNDAIGR